MRVHLGVMLPVVCWCLFLTCGCAKQVSVKKDEPIDSAAVKPVVTSSVDAVPVRTDPMPQAASLIVRPMVNQEGAVRQQAADAGQLQASPDRIYFNFDSYALSNEARDTLMRITEFMKKGETVKVRIEGNCDELGSDEYNLALGERRARAAMQYLVAMGIPEERLTVISYGKERPADQGHDSAARAKNRRDEFAVVSN